MPTIITRGNATADGYGFGLLSTGASGLIGEYILASAPSYSIMPFSNTGFITTGTNTTASAYEIFNSSGSMTYYGNSTDSNTFAQSSKVDSSGNYYVAGISGSYSPYAYITKFNSSNSTVWNKSSTALYGGGASILPNSIAVDSSSNVFLCGGFNDGTTSYGFITKFNSSGTQQWQKSYYVGSATAFNNNQLVLDTSSNVYIMGNQNSNVQFIVAYNTSGTLLWSYVIAITGTTLVNINNIGIDSSNNLYISGIYKISGVSYPVLIKLNSSGTVQWCVQLALSTTHSNLLNFGLAVDSSGNSYVTCSYNTTSNLNYIIKVDNTGSVVWARTIMITSTYNYNGLILNAISIDNKGSYYLTGQIYPGASGFTPFFARLPTDGSKTGSQTFNSITVAYLSTTVTASAQAYSSTSTSPVGSGNISFGSYGNSWSSASTLTSYVSIF